MSAHELESALLCFDEQHPCWTAEMFPLAGLDEKKAECLLKQGSLAFDDGIYYLTKEGAELFKRAAQDNFLPINPGLPTHDKRLSASRSKLILLLDRRHLQRWGIKEYVSPFCFDVPDIPDEELFNLEGDRLEWQYLKTQPFITMLRDFPMTGTAARRKPAPSLEFIKGWLNRNVRSRRTSVYDLLYRSRYDFQVYAEFKPLPADPCSLLNTDRFIFSFAPKPVKENLNAYLMLIGEFHMMLTMLRRMYMPGYTDLDSHDQDSVSWLMLTFEHEEDSIMCAEMLKSYSDFFEEPAGPFDIWSISMEALNRAEYAEMIWELLSFTAHPISRAGQRKECS